jgi:hypothetical protein
MVAMQKQKKLKITLIGSSDKLKVNDIGSPYLHLRNSVTITKIGNSNVGRAIVCDQHIIDKSFLEKKITAQQHNVCNKYLELIVRSGTFGSSGSSGLGDKIFTSHSSLTAVPRAVMLCKVQNKIIKECGYGKEKMFWKIMVNNPKSLDERKELVMQDCSNALLTFWYINQKNPVSLFQQSLVNQV